MLKKYRNLPDVDVFGVPECTRLTCVMTTSPGFMFMTASSGCGFDLSSGGNGERAGDVNRE